MKVSHLWRDSVKATSLCAALQLWELFYWTSDVLLSKDTPHDTASSVPLYPGVHEKIYLRVNKVKHELIFISLFLVF